MQTAAESNGCGPSLPRTRASMMWLLCYLHCGWVKSVRYVQPSTVRAGRGVWSIIWTVVGSNRYRTSFQHSEQIWYVLIYTMVTKVVIVCVEQPSTMRVGRGFWCKCGLWLGQISVEPISNKISRYWMFWSIVCALRLGLNCVEQPSWMWTGARCSVCRWTVVGSNKYVELQRTKVMTYLLYMCMHCGWVKYSRQEIALKTIITPNNAGR